MTSQPWPGSTRIYDAIRKLNAASLDRNWRIDGEGLDRLENFRSGILAINHAHFVDGTVIMPLVRERVLFLADVRAVDSPILGHLLRAMGVLRVDVMRPDPAAALAALRAASDRHLLGVFPEGRVSGGGLRPARSGIVSIARALELPVLPVAMWGLEAFDRPLDVYVRGARPTIHIRAGAPIAVRPPKRDRDARRSAADAVMLAIARMLPEERRGVYREGTEPYESGARALDLGWVRPIDDGGTLGLAS